VGSTPTLGTNQINNLQPVYGAAQSTRNELIGEKAAAFRHKLATRTSSNSSSYQDAPLHSNQMQRTSY
jgi:hypothetical protein